MQPQGRQQTEDRQGHPLGDDLQIDVLAYGCRWQAVKPPLQPRQLAPLA
jgi:hypothetical protein